MQELVILFQNGNIVISAYGVGAAVAYLLACLLCRVNVRKCFWLCLLLPAGALVGARAVYYFANIVNIQADYGGGAFAWQIFRGGFSLCGALLGGLAVAALAARLRGEMPCELMQRLLPSVFLALAIMRLCEFFTPEGVGRFLEAETPVFPFTVWSEVQYGCVIPVFFWEAVAALLGCVYCQVRVKGGETLSRGLGWLFATQIVLESLRGDSFLRFGFVRFHQLAAVVGMFCLMLWNFSKGKASGREKGWRAVVYAVAVLGAVGIEFALDRTAVSHVLLYVLLGLCAGSMFVSCTLFRGKTVSEDE